MTKGFIEGSATFRGTTPAGEFRPIEGPSDRTNPFEEESPNWPVAEPRPLQGPPDLSPLLPGGLYIGATGSDAAGAAYRLVAPLDRGGMGELFVAEVESSAGDRRYAVIKRLLPDLMDDRDYVEMFRAEAEVMARLDHPSVVRVLGLPTLEGTVCLALEFVDGRSAQQLISRTRRLGIKTPPGVAAHIVARVAEALDHVHHARGKDGRPLDLVHRDVSPGNVLLGFDGSVKLTDFGIAKSRMSAVSTTVGIVKGKARYLAPEQILGRPATPRSDLFAAALVLVELLTGKPLFERGSIPKTLYAIVHGEREPMQAILPQAATPLADLLEAALTTEPERRLPTARALAEGLDGLATSLGPPVDAAALGHHLRGLFAGTQGPLTRAVQVPPVALQKTGAAPLDPATFRGELPISSPDADVSAPLPLLEPIEAPANRSAPDGVDEALSVLAWLQSRREAAEASPIMTSIEPPTEPTRVGSRAAMLFVSGLLAGALATGLAVAAASKMDGFERLHLAAPSPGPAEEAVRPPGGEPERAPLPAEAAADQPTASTLGRRPGPVFVLEALDPEWFIGPPAAPPPPPPPAAARLEVSMPKRAIVLVDGQRVGLVPLRGVELSPGLHSIVVRRGRRERLFEVRAAPGEVLHIGRDLRRGKDPAPSTEKTR